MVYFHTFLGIFGSDVTPDTTELQDTVKRFVFMQQNVKFHLKVALLS